MKLLTKDPSIECITRDQIGEPCYDRDSGDLPIAYGLSSIPWNLDRIDEENVSDEDVFRCPYTGSGVHAYIVDTGIRSTHIEFTNSLGSSYYAEGSSAFVDNKNHGTGVASVLAGNYLGVAPNSIIHSVKATHDGWYSTCDVIDCIDWIMEDVSENGNSPAVCNMSFNFSTWVPGVDDQDDTLCPSYNWMESVITEMITDCDVTVVVSAGNEDSISPSLYSPARMSTVITVSSHGRYWSHQTSDDQDDVTDRYSRGTGTDIFAPGTVVIHAKASGDNTIGSGNGTSYSAPMVAGVAACYLEKYPTASPSQVKNYIINNALEGKLDGDRLGAPDRMLHYSDWWYPYHTANEWDNSDTATSDDHEFPTSVMGDLWTGFNTYYPWFYREGDDAWLEYVTDTPWITFINWSAYGHPVETYDP